jgi:hypothetical protein
MGAVIFFINIVNILAKTMISQILFVIVSAVAIYFFSKNLGKIRRNILLGKDVDISDNKPERWKTMLKVAFGQTKMAARPIPFVLHLIVYVGFVLINIEVLEILIDGIFGTHRVLSVFGKIYNLAIGFFEILALGVLVACIIFLCRRYIVKLDRFQSPELNGFANKDATIILFVEIVLMGALLNMNGADQLLQARGSEHYTQAGSFPISSWLVVPFYHSFSDGTLMLLERVMWWFHIIGILAFLNYLPYSKHFHILLAFPNVYYSNLEAQGHFTNMSAVTKDFLIKNNVNLLNSIRLFLVCTLFSNIATNYSCLNNTCFNRVKSSSTLPIPRATQARALSATNTGKCVASRST